MEETETLGLRNRKVVCPRVLSVGSRMFLIEIKKSEREFRD